MKKNILIIGASGHAKVIIDIIEKENTYTIFGLIDTYKKKGDKLYDYDILGKETDIPKIVEENDIYGGVIAIGDNWVRKLMFEKISNLSIDFKYITTIHPDAIIGSNLKIGDGVVVMPGVVINSNVRIDNCCILNTKSFLGSNSIMKDFSSLGPGAVVDYNVTIEDCSVISLGVCVVNNMTIGKNSIIGAGSTVVDDIPISVIAFGTPAKEIRERKSDEKYLSGKRMRL
jgi:sugar O-acyltransferase (sialic acid O-acetyltransferase NeuD family)